jgi:LuxR family maltose regulon positive regulatory protein
LALARARVLLAQGRREAAQEQLAALRERAAHLGWQSTVVRTRVLQALAAPTHDEARAILVEALALAEPEGYVRAFLDLGAPMRALIAQVVAGEQDAAPAYARLLLQAFDAEQAAAPRTGLTPPPAQPQIEPLSERELEVLSLLAEGKMRQEIAQELTISVNTVKAHLKGIYGKLDVHNRREAVTRARALGLLSP